MVNADNAVDNTEKTGQQDFEILIKDGSRKIILDYRDILFAQELKDYTILQTGSRKYVVKGPVKAVENYLPANFFIRVHKSFIVTRHMIKMIHKNKIEIGDITIPIGRSYKEAVEQYTRTKAPARKD